MTSPARRHFERERAAREAATAASGQIAPGASRYELMLAKLATDRVRLGDVQSAERKAEVKREVLPDYVAYIDGVLEGGRGAQDDVLATVMIWRIDAGDYAGALQIAAYAIAHKLKLPDQFARTLPAALAEEFADAALKALQDEGGMFDAELLARVGELTDAQDMPDQVRAKLCKAYGRALLTGGPLTRDTRWRYEAAILAFRRAQQLDPRAGVKQVGDRTEKELIAFDGAQSAPPAVPPSDANQAGGDPSTGA